MILLSNSPDLAPDPEMFIGIVILLAISLFVLRFVITCLLLAVIAIVFKYIFKTNFSWIGFILSGFIGFTIGTIIQFSLIGNPSFYNVMELPQILSLVFVLVYLIAKKKVKKNLPTSGSN